MRIFEATVALLVLLLVVVLVRVQFDNVADEITSGDRTQQPLFPIVTPVYESICTETGSSCIIPTVGPLFPELEEPPFRGLSVP